MPKRIATFHAPHPASTTEAPTTARTPTAPLLLGIDAAEPQRIADLLARHRDRFLHRVFTPDEAAYAAEHRQRETEHLAARFAAKEATFKALGVGWADGIAWTDVAIKRHNTGKPELILTGHAATLAKRLGATAWTVSLTHTRNLAIAAVAAHAPSP